MQQRTEAKTGRVTVDDELVLEVGQLQRRPGGERLLEGAEGVVGVDRPCECLLLEEVGEWLCDGAVVTDELAVVAREAEKAA
jgi:hypothetical protein